MPTPKNKQKKIHARHNPDDAHDRSLALQPDAAQLRTPHSALHTSPEPTSIEFSPAIHFRPYQEPVFRDRQSGILVLHWSRQIGKSFTLAAWAVDRLITRPGRLVTVLSNSRENGAEFLAKCVEICQLNRTRYETVDESHTLHFEAMRLELHIRAHGLDGRIKILAANPRTARGFSGDLILDEFAFHEDSAAIWEAVEPILASNPDYLCRIASTGNGKHNLFYRLAAPSAECGVRSAEFSETAIPEPIHAIHQIPVAFGDGRSCNQNVKINRRETSLLPLPKGEGRGEGEGDMGTCNAGRLEKTGMHSDTTAAISDFKSEISKGRNEVPLVPKISPVTTSNQERKPTSKSRISNVKSETSAVVSESAGTLPSEKSAIPNPQSAIAPLPRGGPFLAYSQTGFILSRVTRTQAHWLGVIIHDPRTRKQIDPATARAQALDKRVYDQNYECSFADENLTLLTHELISAAEHDGVGEISDQNWTPTQLANLHAAIGPLYVGFDVARKADLSVITVLEKLGDLFYLRALLRIQDMRLPDQQLRLGEICRLPKFQRVAIDMTGLGLGLFEYAQKEFGCTRIHGINFATTVPATRAIQQEGRKRETVRVTEALALELLQTYEDRRIRQPIDTRLRDDLRKPERVTTPGGRVSIAATRDEAGHADHFWSLALALEAAATASGPFAYQPLNLHAPQYYKRTSLI